MKHRLAITAMTHARWLDLTLAVDVGENAQVARNIARLAGAELTHQNGNAN